MQIGDVVHMVFLDHCKRSGVEECGPITCEVFGRVVKKDKKTTVVASWQLVNILDDNAETFVILNSTVESVKVLK